VSQSDLLAVNDKSKNLAQLTGGSASTQTSQESLISSQELQASQEIDNMSISEIIQKRFKGKMSVNEVKTPKEVAEVIIKAPEEANLV